MVFFGKSKDKSGKGSGRQPVLPPDGQPLPVAWARTAGGKFPRLADLDPEATGLGGKGGVYVVWHGGVRPEWVYIGKAGDLAVAMHALGANKNVMYFDKLGGLYVTWVVIDEEYRDGILKFLDGKLRPVTDCPDVPAEDSDIQAIPVIPPGL